MRNKLAFGKRGPGARLEQAWPGRAPSRPVGGRHEEISRSTVGRGVRPWSRGPGHYRNPEPAHCGRRERRVSEHVAGRVRPRFGRLSWTDADGWNDRHDPAGGAANRGAAGGNEGVLACPCVRRHRAAVVGWARLGIVQSHGVERGADLLRPGAPAHLRVQPWRGAARISQGAAARSGMCHVLLGRGPGARPQHQSADAG